ncbi:MAG: PepSY domain-containing protein [Sphingomonadales bacterium]|nr:PepSY domain-containing protein [Sphingomonadales bacterium]
MSLLDTLHRWAGGLIGLVLALLGLTGAILVHKDAWVMLPHTGDARVTDVRALAQATQRMMTGPQQPQSIIYASDSFGLDRLTFAKGAGAYADQSGAIVTAWQSQWARPELWLFDFHHHLFAGDAGETVIGVAALCGLFFVVSGVILWWRTRSTFEFRLIPKRLSRPAIVRHHRDLGIVMAPLLALSLVTGAVFVFRPVASLILGPGTQAELKAASQAPEYKPVPLAANFDWGALIEAAHARFPKAELRIVAPPRGDSGLVTVRMRQPEEWLPNGRTMLWFAADTGALVGARDARDVPLRVTLYNRFYPLHAAKVGGLPYRMVMTASGLALAMLGSLAVWTFWFRRPRKARVGSARPVAARS